MDRSYRGASIARPRAERYWGTPVKDSAAPVPEQKKTLRAKVRAELAEMSIAARQRAAERVRRHLATWRPFTKARAVLFYLSTSEEPGLDAFFDAPAVAGRVLCAPRVDWDNASMEPMELPPGPPITEIRRHGVREPVGGKPVPVAQIDLVFVPGIAFDHSGGRLGRGGGFYDRFLERWRAEREQAGAPPGLAVGVCFASQLFTVLPLEPHDARVNALATDIGARLCRPAG